MDLFNFRKFIAIVVLGYFSIKIYYSFLFDNSNELKCSNKELVDFSITCVMSSLVYILTNFDFVMMNSIIYYIGFLIGTQCVVFKKLLLDTIDGTNLKEFLTYLILIIYGVVFIYFYVIKNLNSSIINPLLIIISIISLVIGLLLTAQKKTRGYKLLKINSNMGFLSFIGSLLIIHMEENNIIAAFFQSILIGSFVCYFSYYQPEFILDRKDNTNYNISIINFTELISRMIDKFDKKDSSSLSKIFNDFTEKLNKTVSNNLSHIKTHFQKYDDSISEIDTMKNDMTVTKYVTGLCYITILIIVTITYINYQEQIS